MKTTYPQFHRRRGWSLCSWCGGHAVEDRHKERNRETGKYKVNQNMANKKYMMFALKQQPDQTNTSFIFVRPELTFTAVQFKGC